MAHIPDSLISLCAVPGVEKSPIQAWVGHLSDEITEHYTHLSEQHAAQAMSKVKL